MTDDAAIHKVFVLILLVVLPGSAVGQSDGVESDPALVREVLGPGYPIDRVRVDARHYPWSAVGRITQYDSTMRPGGRASCSGTLIAENLVLTAAHCVWNRRRHPQEIFFLAGFQQGAFVAHSKAKAVHFHEAYRSGRPSPRTFAVDWAIIELEEPIGREAGYVGVADFDAGVLARIDKERTKFKVSGYRGDRLLVQTVDEDCRIDGFTRDEKLILHRCPITKGDSGGPVLLPVRGELLVIGTDVGIMGVNVDMNGERRKMGFGVATPSSGFSVKLRELGIAMETLNGTPHLVGRRGQGPVRDSAGDPPQ